MKKITLFVAALFATTMAFASTATITPAAMGIQGADSTNLNPTTPYSTITYTVGEVTLTIDSGFCSGSQIRAYTGAKVVFTATNNITKIEITTKEGDKNGTKDKYSASALSGTGYTATKGATSGVWEGTAAKSVTLSASAQCRILNIVVTTEGEGADAGKIDTLKVSVAEALKAIEALKDGAVAVNYYILSGKVSDLDLSVDNGNATFTLTDETGSITIFRARNLENAKFTSADELANGDEVKVFGQLQRYLAKDATAYTAELVNGYLTERTPATGIRDIEAMSDVYAHDGRIYAEEGARIYTLLGLDVTTMNGQLNGVYVVKNGNKVAKVVVK